MEQPQPIFLPLSHVYRIHRRSLDEHGGMDGVRDPGAVESALAAGINTWLYRDGDLFDIAAAYAFHLAEAQAFIDGNKRIAIAGALHFLAVNGYGGRPDQRVLYDAMIAIARRKLDKAGLAAFLRAQFPARTDQ
jgi:death on curing protein